jgi:hypothetical protein
LERILLGRGDWGTPNQISPIKTRSARKKDGTNTNFFAQQISNKSKIGVLRGKRLSKIHWRIGERIV